MKSKMFVLSLVILMFSATGYSRTMFSCISGGEGGALVNSLDLNLVNGKYEVVINDVFGSKNVFTNVKRTNSVTSTQLLLNVDGNQKTSLAFSTRGNTKKAVMIYSADSSFDVEFLNCKYR